MFLIFARLTSLNLKLFSNFLKFGFGIFLLTSCTFNLDVSSRGQKIIPAKNMQVTLEPSATYVAGTSFNPAIEVTYFDESGNVDVEANRPITVSFAVNPGSATLDGTLTKSPTLGVTVFNEFNIKKASSGYQLRFENADGLFDTTSTFDIIAADPGSFEITTLPLVLSANQCSPTPLRFDVADVYGNLTSLTNDLTASFSGLNLEFFSDAACSNPIANLPILAGSDHGLVYVRSNVAGSHTFTVTGPGFISDSQTVLVNPAAAGSLAFTSSSQTLTAGQCSGAAVIQSRDLFGNPTDVLVNTTVNLSGTGMTFYLDANCLSAPVTSIDIQANTRLGTFYFIGITAGTIPLTAAATSYTSAIQNQTLIAAAPTQLGFITSPSDTVAGTSMTPSVQVAFQDQYGNTATSTTGSITLELDNNPGGIGTLINSPLTASAVSGVATFSGPQALQINEAAVGYTLVARSTGYSDIISSSFDILGSSIQSLSFISSSQNLTAGDCSGSIQVEARDQYGNLARASENTVLTPTGPGMTFYSDSSCTTSISTATILEDGHSVTYYFIGTQAGNPVTQSLTVTSGDTAPSINQDHTIVPGPPTSVSFANPARTVEAGFCSERLELLVGDAFGNPVPPVADATLSLAASDGITQFFSDSSCSTDIGTSLTLSSTLNSAVFYFRSTRSGTNTISVSGNADFGSGPIPVNGSQAQTIEHTTPQNLSFQVQPSDTFAGDPIAPAVEVSVLDQYGNICTSFTQAIGISIEDNPPTDAVLVGGNKSVNPTAGVATFTGADALIIEKIGNGFTLLARSTGLPDLESSAFDVNVGPPTRYRFLAAPTNIGAGVCSALVRVQTEDAFGNIAPATANMPVTYNSIPSGAGAIQFFSDSSCTTPAATNLLSGNSQLDLYYVAQTAGPNTLGLTIGTLSCPSSLGCSPDNSQVFNVTPDLPYQITFTTSQIISPNEVEAGSCSPMISLSSSDQFGNRVAVSSDQQIDLVGTSGSFFSDATCTTPINGGSPLRILSGQDTASFYFLTNTTGGGQHTTTATSSFSGTFANAITIPNNPNNSVVAQANAMKAAPPSKFTILQQPGNSIAGQTIAGPFRAELRDRFDNPATNSTAKTFVHVGQFSTATRPTLFGGAGLTAGPNTPVNVPGFNYFPDPPVQALWSFAVAGQLNYTGSLGINIQRAGTYTLHLTALGIDFIPNPTPAIPLADASETVEFTVTNAPASQLVFTSSAQTLTAGVCSGAVTVQAQDPFQNIAPVTTTTEVTPSGTGMTFYSDSSCSAPSQITSVDILNGTHSATFYYVAVTSGSQNLLVQTTGGLTLTSASQAQTINPDVPFQLAYQTAAPTLTAGLCSPAVIFNSRDQFGNNSPVSSDAVVSLTQVATPGTAEVQFFSNSTCTTSVTTSTILTGSFSSTIYARGNITGSTIVRGTPDFRPAGFAEQTFTIQPAALAEIEFFQNGNQTKTAGQCSDELRFRLKDAFGNIRNGSPTTVRFNTSDSGFQFFTDSACSNSFDPAVGITLATTDSEAGFYFRSTISGTRNIQATVATPAVTQVQAQSINPAGFSRFAFVSGVTVITNLNVTAGTCSALKVQAQDEFGNLVDSDLVSQRVIIDSPSTYPAYFTDAACSVGQELPLTPGGDPDHPNESFLTFTNAKEVSFYVRSTFQENTTLTAYHNGVLTPASLAYNVSAGIPNKLAFADTIITSVAGTPIQINGPLALQVLILDQFDNLTTSTATVNLAFDAGNANNTGSTLLGTNSLAAVAGRATFSTTNIQIAREDYSLRATATGLTGVTSNLFDIVAAAPTQLGVTSPSQTVTAGVCSGVVDPAGSTVTLLDPFGNPATFSTDLEIDLAGPGMTFYSDATCTSPVVGNQITIPAGQTSGTYYFMPTTSGPIDITVSRPATPTLTSGTQTQTINPAAANQIGFGNPLRTNLVAGTCSGLSQVIEVEIQDAFGNQTTNSSGSAYTIDLTGYGTDLRIYSDSTCTMEVSKNGSDYQLTIPNGGSFRNIYLRSDLAQTFSLTATVVETSWTEAQNVTITSAPATNISITTPVQNSVVAGTCSAPLTFESTDSLGNESNVTSPATVNLTSDGTIIFYSDATCTTPITQTTIGTGTSTQTVYYRSEDSGSATITIGGGGLAPTQQVTTIIADLATQLAFLQQPTTSAAGQTINPAVTVRVLDQYGNLVPGYAGTINISKDSLPATGTLSGTLTAAINSGVATFNDLSIEIANTAYRLIAQTAGLTNATSNTFNIIPYIPETIYFVTAAQSIDVNNCSTPVSVGLRDEFNNITTTNSSINLNLTGSGVRYFTDSSCTVEITNIDIPATQGTAQFYFLSETAGSVPLNVAATGFTAISQIQTIAPGVPTKLAFSTGSQTLRSGECSAPVELEAQDANNNASPVTTSVTANLLGSNYIFYSDATCSTPITQVTLNLGETSKEIYIRGNALGDSDILATASGFSPNAQQTHTIVPGFASRFSFLTSSQNLLTNECSDLVRFETQDVNGNDTTVENPVVVDLTPTLGLVFYSDDQCTNPITSVIINPNSPSVGASEGEFYFSTSSIAGNAITEVEVYSTNSVDADRFKVPDGSASLGHTVTAREPTELSFVSPLQTFRVNTCSQAITVQSEDTAGNRSNVTSPTTINLAASNSVSYFSDATCSTPLSGSTINLASGQSQVTFYMRSNNSGTTTLQATAVVSGNNALATQDFTITPATASSLAMIQQPMGMIKVDTCYDGYVVELRDRFGNPTPADIDYEIVLSSVNAQYYRDANCTDEILPLFPSRDRVLRIQTGQTQLPRIYMKSFQTGFDNTVFSSNAGIQNTFQIFFAFPSTPALLSILSEPATIAAGTCTAEPIEFMVTDRLGFETTALEDISIALSLNPAPSSADVLAGRVSFYTNSNCTGPISSVTVPKDSSRVSIYFRSERAQRHTLLADALDSSTMPATAFPTAQQALTVETNLPVEFRYDFGPTLAGTGLCSSAFRGRIYDSFGNVVNYNLPVRFTITSGSGLQFFQDDLCTQEVLPSGAFGMSNTSEFFVRGSTPGNVQFDIENFQAIGYLPISFPVRQITITDSDVDKLAVTTPVPRVGYDFCSPIATVELQDKNSVPKVVTAPGGLNVRLTGNHTRFYSTSDCNPNSEIEEVNIPNGSSTASFYFEFIERDNNANFSNAVSFNRFSLTATDIAGTSLNYEVLHLPSAYPYLSNIGGSTIPTAVLLEACTLVDAKYNRPNYQYPLTISVGSSANMELYTDASCTTSWTNPNIAPAIAIGGSESLPNMYVKATSAPTGWYEYTEPHLNPGRVNVSVKEFQIRVGSQPVIEAVAGTCTPISIQSLDHLGNPRIASDAPVALDLQVRGPPFGNVRATPTFYSDAGCTTAINLTQIDQGQSSKTVYLLHNTTQGGDTLTTSVSDSRYFGSTNSISILPGAASRLVLARLIDSFDSVIQGACSPPLRYQSIDSFGNQANVGTNTTVNLSAQRVDAFGNPAGVGQPQNGVTFYADSTCSGAPITSTMIPAGTNETGVFYFNTNFGREQFALILDAPFASTFAIMSSAIDRIGFSAAPVNPTTHVYECRTFSIQHQEVVGGNPIEPEKTITFTVRSSNSPASRANPPLGYNEFMKFYNSPDCSGDALNTLTGTITPSPGTPTAPETELNVTKTFSLISTTLSPIQLTVSSAGRLSSTITMTSTPPPGSRVILSGVGLSVEAGLCSGNERYVTDFNLSRQYNAVTFAALRTSDATGSKPIYGGSNTSVDLTSSSLRFYSDPGCNNEITSATIGIDQGTSSAIFYRSELAGPNEASALGRITTSIAGLTGRGFYSISPGPVYQIAFGSDEQTVRAGDCSQDLVLQVQDRFGNEQVDSVRNEVSFLYPAGFTLYSNNTCTANIATTFIEANQSSKTVWFRADNAGSAFVEPLPVRDLEAQGQTQTILSGSASFLRFSNSPQTVPKGICSSAMTVQIQDFAGNPVPAAANTTVGLFAQAGTGMLFYTDSQCTKPSEVTSVLIPNGQSSAQFYFISFKEGTNEITAKEANYVDAKQTQTIVAGLPSRLAFVDSNSEFLAGQCSQRFEVEITDIYGGRTSAAAPTTVSLSAPSTTFYSDNTCMTPIVNLNISAGDQVKSFYMRRNTAGDFTATFTDTALGTLTPAVQIFTVRPKIMAATRFITTALTLPVGRCSTKKEIGVVDEFGNFTKVTDNRNLLLTLSGSGIQFFRDESCSVPLPSNQILLTGGSTKGEFYFSSNTTGTRNISVANNSGLEPNSQAQTFIPSAPQRLAFATGVRTVSADQCSQVITVMTQDQFNFETVAGQNYTVDLASNASKIFYSTPTCTPGSEITSVVISTGTSRADFYAKAPTIAGTSQISLTTVGLTATNQNFITEGSVPSSLTFVSAAQTGVVVETCSAQVRVGLLDAFGNEAQAVGNTQVNLSSPGAVFYSDLACTNLVTQVSIANAQRFVNLYFRPTQVGSVQLDAASTGLTPASQIQTVVSGSANKLVFSSPARNFVAGICQTATIQSQDAFNNPSAPASNRTINLAASGSPTTFYSSLDCSGAPATSVTQLSGSSSVTFSFMITQRGTSGFSGTASGLSQASQTQTIQPSAPTQWAFATASRTFVAGLCSANITVQSRDTFGNPSELTATTTLTLSSPELNFFSDSSCLTPISTVDILSGTHSATFYTSTTVSGSWAVDITGGSFALVTQNQTVNPDVISQLGYLNAPLDITAGTCQILNMQFQDQYANATTIAGSRLITYQISGVNGRIYSDAGCTSEITTQNVTNSSSWNAYFRSTESGLSTVRISTPGLNFADQTQTIRAGTPSQISFETTSLSVAAGQCSGAVGPVIIRLEDSLGNAAATAAPASFVLSGTGFTFFTDASCTASTSSLLLNTGASTTQFYFRRNQAGVAPISVAMTGFTTVQQNQTIISLPASKVGFNQSTFNTTVGVCTAITAQTQDSFNNMIAATTDVTVNLAVTSGSLSIFSDSGCTAPITSILIPNGAGNSATFYVRNNTSGTAILQASDAAVTLSNGTSTVNFNSGSPTAIAFTTASQTPTAGVCSGVVTVQARDSFGNPTNVPANRTVNLSATPAVVPASDGILFFSDSGCNSNVTSITILSGTQSASYYYRANRAQTYTFSAASTGFTTINQNHQVLAGPASTITVASGANQSSVQAGACSAPLVVEGRDAFNNPAHPTANLSLALSATNLAFFSDVGCSSTITNTNIPTTLTSTTFYFRSTLTGARVINITGTLSTTTNATIVPATPQVLQFIAPVTALHTDTCSPAFAVKTTDQFGNDSPVSSSSQVSLSTTPSNSQLYTDLGCVNQLTSNLVTVGSGTFQSNNFYVKDTVNGTFGITAQLAGYSSATSNVAVSATGPRLQIYNNANNALISSGGQFSYGVAAIDTPRSFYLRNDGTITSGVINIQLQPDLAEPAPLGSATMWTLVSDLCSGQTLAPAATCLITVRFNAQTGSRPSGDFYYSNVRVNSAPVPSGATTIDVRLLGIKQ